MPADAAEDGVLRVPAKASLDEGVNWVRDAVPVAWVMVDPPQVDGLRLYTLLPTASGSIGDWTADLERIKAMGFNAVHLLPITRLDVSGARMPRRICSTSKIPT